MTANILLVDDEERVLEAYKLALRKEFQFDTATGGQEALKRIDAGANYQVIVADMRMPVMNGVEFLAKAKKRCPDRRHGPHHWLQDSGTILRRHGRRPGLRQLL